MSVRRRFITLVAAVIGLVLLAAPVAAHEVREVAGYQFVVGFIGEPVFTNQKSGLEFEVTLAGEPVEGLEETLDAEVTFGDQTRALELLPRFGAPGWYQSVFFPTAAGPYTYRIFGDIDGQAIDEAFMSSPDGFGEVEDATTGQFPIVFPATGDVVRDAEAGAGAATTATIALVAGVAGLLAGVVALGMTLGRRRA